MVPFQKANGKASGMINFLKNFGLFFLGVNEKGSLGSYLNGSPPPSSSLLSSQLLMCERLINQVLLKISKAKRLRNYFDRCLMKNEIWQVPEHGPNSQVPITLQPLLAFQLGVCFFSPRWSLFFSFSKFKKTLLIPKII